MYTPQQLDRTRKLAYTHTGIILGANKDVMISNRLDKLKHLLKNDDINDVLTMVEQGRDIDVFISAFTTNKTNFFRESFHFEDLRNRVAKDALERNESLKVYCCAASTGEEPYSILMTLQETKERHKSSFFNYSLIATDIDKQVLSYASNGIYEWDKNSSDFPAWITPSQYFKRREHPTKEGDYLIKAKESISRNVKFQQMNLMSPKYPFQNSEFDVVFCRNVLIYFNQEDQNSILRKVFGTLKIGGTLYLGHSESPLELSSYVDRCGQNIFIKTKEIQ